MITHFSLSLSPAPFLPAVAGLDVVVAAGGLANLGFFLAWTKSSSSLSMSSLTGVLV